MAKRRRRRHRRPELNEDVTEEILLRIPPDEPAHLFRASFVCKLWLRIASSPAFLRRYTAFHRGAPLLGFFCNLLSADSFADFASATAAPLAHQGPSDWVRWVPDSRHDRVLLRGMGRKTFVVWDLFNNHRDELEVPSSRYSSQYNVAVICAMPGCDHRSCRGGPFRVVFVGIDKSDHGNVHAHVYSSESRSWGTPASARLGGKYNFVDTKRAALIGDGIYCTVNDGAIILKYNLVEHRLSVTDMPNYVYESAPVLMQNVDGSLGIAGVLSGSLGIAGVLGSRLHLWSTIVNAEGFTGWVKQRVITLKEILPVDVTSPQANVRVIGFAEGVEVFFISTNAGAFTFELKSGRVRKVGEPRDYHCATPFISFCTPGPGCSKWTK